MKTVWEYCKDKHYWPIVCVVLLVFTAVSKNGTKIEAVADCSTWETKYQNEKNRADTLAKAVGKLRIKPVAMKEGDPVRCNSCCPEIEFDFDVVSRSGMDRTIVSSSSNSLNAIAKISIAEKLMFDFGPTGGVFFGNQGGWSVGAIAVLQRTYGIEYKYNRIGSNPNPTHYAGLAYLF